MDSLDPVISGESLHEDAERQIAMLYDYYDINLDDYRDVNIADNEANDVLRIAWKKLVRAAKQDRLRVEDVDGEVHVTIELRGKYPAIPEGVLHIKPYGGNADSIMGKVKQKPGEDVSGPRMFALFGVLTGLKPTAIQGLRGPDLKTVQHLNSVFLL